MDRQINTSNYTIINDDCIEAMRQLPNASVHLSLYSPPFCGLYQYSSNDRDLSNCDSYDAFFQQYAFVINEIKRITLPGRMTVVHCMDVPGSNSGKGDYLIDFTGDIIRAHNNAGFKYVARYSVWKEPLTVRNRTMMKSLAHKTIVDDSSKCANAGADFLLVFRAPGENLIPVTHPEGLSEYYGETPIPEELNKYKKWAGLQIENRLSHWIWRQYASSVWGDIRLDNVLTFKPARDSEDEKHVHPLQLDVIGRICTLWSNPGEVILTPFMGVGSEVFGAVTLGRKAIGIELKESYFQQAIANLKPLNQRLMLNPKTYHLTKTDDPDFPGQDVTGNAEWEEVYACQ